jgi:hypothetical protein
MLYDRKQLDEIYLMKHKYDDDNDFVNYENKLFDRTLSPYIYENDIMNSFLKKLQVLASVLFDQMNIAKNFRNIMVDKYYYKHKN